LIYILSIFLFSNACSLSIPKHHKKAHQSEIYKNIKPAQARKLIKENKDNPNFVILDVRTEREFKNGHLKNAKNIDFFSNSFQDSLKKLDTSNMYFIYCKGGNRSSKALSQMKEMGFQKIYNLLGGITRWQKEGYPIVQ